MVCKFEWREDPKYPSQRAEMIHVSKSCKRNTSANYFLLGFQSPTSPPLVALQVKSHSWQTITGLSITHAPRVELIKASKCWLLIVNLGLTGLRWQETGAVRAVNPTQQLCRGKSPLQGLGSMPAPVPFCFHCICNTNPLGRSTLCFLNSWLMFNLTLVCNSMAFWLCSSTYLPVHWFY